MAELPDLQVFAGILHRKFSGKTLKKLEVKVTKKLNVTVSDLEEAIQGKKLSSVTRDGKTLHFHFSGGNILQIHLMLRGSLVLLDKENPPPKYTILEFHFSSGNGFAVVDFLKQARATLNPEKAKAPDALEMDLGYFEALLSKSKKMIKEVMMDQKKMRGIGNSYADEILWEAKVSPLSIASLIPDKVVKRLFKSLVTVLKDAIDSIAKENGDELKPELRDFMKVHGARIEQSPTGAEIQSVKIGGRSSYFTKEQVLYN